MTGEPKTIADVVRALDAIIAWARDDGDRLGYFPALYRKVTVKIAEGIDRGFFDDGPRMERLDVAFANRYLTAVEAHRRRAAVTAAWGEAFAAARSWSPIVLQHLLLGMNAHINLDLGLAVAQTVSSSELPLLRADFDRINQVLSDLVGEVRDELAQIWPVQRVFNRWLGRSQTVIVNFSMEKARDQAWVVAQEMASIGPAERERAIARLDMDVTELARLIRHPGIQLGLVTRLVRLGEMGSVRRKIDILL